MKEYINDYLEAYSKEDWYPWHMPGHKRQDVFENDFWRALFQRDFTEAKNLDDMHEPELFMKDSMRQMQAYYGTIKTYMMVNGATGGILAALYACAPEHSTVLVARNCHKSVCHAVSLLNLEPEYILPDEIPGTRILGDITPEQTKKTLEKLAAGGRLPSVMILTSPTYEGVISDISGILQVLKPYNIPLIVDEAHGAHLPFMGEDYAKSAVTLGADIVIQSTHKTLPALTQTALLHVNRSDLVSRVERYLQVFQTSSPSYLFIQSIEKAVVYAAAHASEFKEYRKKLENFRKKCIKFEHIKLLEPEKTCYAYDRCKLVFFLPRGTGLIEGKEKTVRVDGPWLADMLADKYHLIVEMAGENHIVIMTSTADRAQAYERLFQALLEIDRMLERTEPEPEPKLELYLETKPKSKPESNSESELKPESEKGTDTESFHLPERKLIPGAAWNMDRMWQPLAKAGDAISGEYVYAYPPGIAVLAPGEVIDSWVIRDITKMVEAGRNVIGVDIREDGIYLPVLKENSETA